MAAYEVFALRYATSAPGRLAHENFIAGADPHDAPMPLDYYIWVIRGEGRELVVDTGFGAEAAKKRNRTLLHEPAVLLARIGIDASRVEHVILTHLHYDHAGSLSAFPNATFHVQDSEMAFATGRPMCHACFRAPFEVKDVQEMVGRLYAGQVKFHNGDSAFVPGIDLFRIGGHSGGLQVVRVTTKRGPLILASDAFHFNANRLKRSPFPIVFNVGEMMEGFMRCEELAEHDESLLVPGHDPDVLRRWPRALPDCPDIVRLDLAPIA